LEYPPYQECLTAKGDRACKVTSKFNQRLFESFFQKKGYRQTTGIPFLIPISAHHDSRSRPKRAKMTFRDLQLTVLARYHLTIFGFSQGHLNWPCS
jgi:hypothetical protein